MDNTKLLRYSLQLSMLKQLLQLKLISEKEYQLIEKTIKKLNEYAKTFFFDTGKFSYQKKNAPV